MDIKQFVLRGVDWIYMAQERDKWRALVRWVISVVLEIYYIEAITERPRQMVYPLRTFPNFFVVFPFKEEIR
jgi:hypothetical protein